MTLTGQRSPKSPVTAYFGDSLLNPELQCFPSLAALCFGPRFSGCESLHGFAPAPRHSCLSGFRSLSRKSPVPETRKPETETSFEQPRHAGVSAIEFLYSAVPNSSRRGVKPLPPAFGSHWPLRVICGPESQRNSWRTSVVRRRSCAVSLRSGQTGYRQRISQMRRNSCQSPFCCVVSYWATCSPESRV